MSGDLRKFQDASQVQASLNAVPASPPASSGTQQALGFIQSFGAPIASAIAVNQQAKGEAARASAVGSLTTKLANIQQAGMVDSRINVQQAQRKAFTEWSASNADLSTEGMKAFSESTGIKVAGLSSEQQAQQKIQETAWSSGFGSPTSTPAENKRQLDIYQSIQRESQVMTFEAARGTADAAEKKKRVQASTAKLSTWKTESLKETLDADLQAIKNGSPREGFVSKWMKLKVDWSNELAQYGEFANDPTIKAQLTGIEEMFSYADGMVNGSTELSALESQINISVAKQQAILTSSPEGARMIAISKAFGHTPAAQLPVSNYVANVLSKPVGEPADARTIVGSEGETVHKTLDNMGLSEDPIAQEQASQQIVQMAKHMGRNGEDYTDEQLLQVCSIISAPSAYNKMSGQDKELVQNACETYAVDVAGKAIREIEKNGSVALSTVSFKPGGQTTVSDRRSVPTQDFSTLTVDSSGLRYTVKPEYKNDRQVRRQIQNLNRELSKINPVLTILSTTTGQSPEQVAADTWGIGPVAEERAMKASQEAQKAALDTKGGLAVLTGEMSQRIGTAQTAAPATEEPATTSPIQGAMAGLLQREGGFQEDPNDTGNIVNGKTIGTNHGITARSLAAFQGRNASEITKEDIKNVTPELAQQIYEKDYLTDPKIDQLPAEIQDMVFDTGVTSGPATSIKILQKVAGLKPDGLIGPKTIEAAATVDREELRNAIIKHYEEVGKKGDNDKFIEGWINRINSL